MGDIKLKYGLANQAITITLDSLASSATAGRASTAVDNTTNCFMDALVHLTIVFPNSTPANDKAVYVYAYGCADGGTNYDGGITGTDAAYTMNDPPPMPLVAVLGVPTANLTYHKTFSIAQAFGGVLPAKWGIFVRNFGGQTL